MQKSLDFPDLLPPAHSRVRTHDHDEGDTAKTLRTDGLSPAALDIRSGCVRMLLDLGYSPFAEIPLRATRKSQPRRADLLGLNAKGDIIIIEVKSGAADYHADQKWTDYLDYCDRFYFAVDERFPCTLLDADNAMPARTGLIIADRYDAGIVREAATHAIKTAARNKIIKSLALVSGRRLAPTLKR